VFIGCYTRKVQRGGWLRFPKEWLPFIGDHRTVFIMPDPDKNKSLLLVMSDDFNRELERMKDKNVPSEARLDYIRERWDCQRAVGVISLASRELLPEPSRLDNLRRLAMDWWRTTLDLVAEAKRKR